jgi:protein-tyrosine phosphatase
MNCSAMMKIVDMHVHLLAGLDDGPKTLDDAVQMCRMMHAEGVHSTVALAHQNENWPEVTPKRIRQSTQELANRLQEEQVPLKVFPCSEVLVTPQLVEHWVAGKLLSVADRNEFLLLELPHGIYVDLRPMIPKLRQHRIRPILAHAERVLEWIEDPHSIEELIRLGAVVQVTSQAFASPIDRATEKALRNWARRGMIHLLGSDGHSLRRRPPVSAAGVEVLQKWVGPELAEAIAWKNGLAILNGDPFVVPPPQPAKRSWFGRIFGN